MRLCAILIVAFCLACPQPSQAGAPETGWPCFHGPRRDNKSTETGLRKKWPEEGPRRLWTTTGLGKGYSSVSIGGGRIYTSGMIEKKPYVFALDMNGEEIWRMPNGRSWEATRRHAVPYSGARSTPTYDDGRVYHLGERGRLAAFEAKTGEEIWRFDLFKKFGATTPNYGLAESILIDGNRLICCPGGKQGYMVCLDKKTRNVMWANTQIEGAVGYCSLGIAEFGGFRQVLGMSSKVVFGVDIRTGKLLWSVEHGNRRQNNATDPIFHKGYVYASSGYGKGSVVIRLKPVRGGIAAEILWRSRLMDNHHGGVILLDGHLYGSGHRSRGWFCLEMMTGDKAWNEPGKGSLTYAEGMLYCLEEKGTMALVEVSPKKRRIVSSFRLPKGGAGLYWAHPVVCGGRLYVRHADRLFAYDIRAK